jgi:DTW domain-containing protein
MEMRPTCLRCRRPKKVCWCDALRPAESRTRVVFVQHPLEARVPVSTCRMAHLSLPNSELHVALGAEGTPRLEALCKEDDTWVLFPSTKSTPLESLPRPPKNLLVVDGTWDNARKVVNNSPLLSALPRIGFLPDRPGNYRIRKEPKEHCLSTIEAVAHVLSRLEGSPEKFTAMLSAFDAMVEKQLDFIESRVGQNRYAVKKKRNTGRRRAADELKDKWNEVVLFHAEANAYPLSEGRTGPGELLQIVALKPKTQERFSVLLEPRRPLGPHVPLHLDLPEEALAGGASVADALEQFRSFLGQGTPVTWRRFAVDLLAKEGFPIAQWIDLRRALADTLDKKPGSVERAATELGATLPDLQGRALRRVVGMLTVGEALVSGRVQPVKRRSRRARTSEPSAPATA